MKNDLVSFETAKRAKEVGFNEYTNKHCRHNGDPFNYKHTKNSQWEDSYTRPTQALLQKWLREKYKIDINIERYHEGYNGYVPKADYIVTACRTYKEALEFCLYIGLNTVK